MSFRKIQIIDPRTISAPDPGNVYLGQDVNGLWEMDDTGKWWYIGFGTGTTIINTTNNYFNSGVTAGTAGTSGSSGKDGSSGSSGKDGDGSSGTSGIGSSGTSGFSGTSGKNGTGGTSGTSGTSGWGSSGTSGTDGTSATSGTSGTSGSSSTSGSSGLGGSGGTSGTNGSSGTSGVNGAYGGATRRWVLNYNSIIPIQRNFYISTISNRLDLINYININTTDADLDFMDGWLRTWNVGILKIEDWLDLSIVGVYYLNSYSIITNVGHPSFYHIEGLNILGTGGLLVDGHSYLISFVHDSGTSGTSGVNGEFLGSSGSSGEDGYIGTDGTSGTSGSSGSSGWSGGSSGTSGSSGENGTSGSSGSSGENGTSGSSGSSGEDGTSGTSGSSGSSGKDGTSGTSGSSGSSGDGTSGTSGSSGSSGEDGTSGTSGSSGSSGGDGTSGTSGSSGSSGKDGTSGTSGSSGSSGGGTSGTSGSSGSSGGGTSGTSGSSGSSGKDGTSGSSGMGGLSITGITYTNLYNLIQLSGLTIGDRYLIIDYQTVHIIPTTIEIYTGTTEPLLVTALSSHELEPIAYSTIHTEDIIYYNVSNDQIIAPGCTKGFISRRIDTVKNNSFPFDFREVIFRRWQLNVIDVYNSGVTYNRGSVVIDSGTTNIYISLINNNSGNTLYSHSFSSLGELYWYRFVFDNGTFVSPTSSSWSLTQTIGYWYISIPCSSFYLDYHFISDNDYINFYNNNISSSNNDIYEKNNTVITIGGSFINNIIGKNFSQNTIKYFENNIIGIDFTNNAIGGINDSTISESFNSNCIGYNFGFCQIGYSFAENLVGSDWGYFYQNVIGNIFHSNCINPEFNYNIIKGYFERNIIGKKFEYNEIDFECGGNIISYNFIHNIVGNQFIDNIIGFECNYNNFGNSCGGNYISSGYGVFGGNNIGYGFSGNVINDGFSFYGNDIANGFHGNIISVNFLQNTIGNYFSYNIINGNVLGSFFQQNTVFDSITNINFDTGITALYDGYNTEIYLGEDTLSPSVYIVYVRYTDTTKNIQVVNAMSNNVTPIPNIHEMNIKTGIISTDEFLIADSGDNYKLKRTTFNYISSSNHAVLSNLTWTNSAHIGTPNTVASFDYLGNATETTPNIIVIPPTNTTISGTQISLIASGYTSFGDVGYINSYGSITLANANLITNANAVVMCADLYISGNTSGNWLLFGTARNNSWNWNVGNNNGLIYLSLSGTTTQTLTQSIPSGSNNVIQILGVALTSTTMLFKPELVQVEHL